MQEPRSTRLAENSLVLIASSASSPRSDSGTMKSLALEAEAPLTLPNRGLCFAQHLLHMLQAQYAAARQDLLQAAATTPMHGTAPAVPAAALPLGVWSRQDSVLVPYPCLSFPALLHRPPSVPLPQRPCLLPAREPFQPEAGAGELDQSRCLCRSHCSPAEVPAPGAGGGCLHAGSRAGAELAGAAHPPRDHGEGHHLLPPGSSAEPARPWR